MFKLVVIWLFRRLESVFFLTCCAIYPSRLLWCKLPNYISHRDVRLLLNITELDGSQLVVLRPPNYSLFKN